MLRINTDGSRDKGPERERSLDELQQAIGGGYLEHIELPDGRHLLFDEDGKAKGLARNDDATSLFADMAGLHPADYFVGPVLVLEPEEMT